MVENPPSLSVEEKRFALDQILGSATFARSDQLKTFLKFVCEMEMSGRAGELSEYLVGVEALGKSEGFSTADDASVRNRAYALRQKLEKLYAHELPAAQIRVGLQKGTYVPRWADAKAAVAPSPALPDTGPSPAPAFVPIWLRFAATLALGALLGGYFAWSYRASSKSSEGASSLHLDPIVREAWGPLLDPHANVLICVGTAAQLTLLPFDVEFEWQPPIGSLEAPKELYPWYLRYHRFFGPQHLYMDPDMNSPHFGDVLGAVQAIQTLTAAGAEFRLLPERLVPTTDLQTRNVVLFGVPHKSEAVLKVLEGMPFQFVYQPQLRDVAIEESLPGQKPEFYAPKRNSRAERVESYALITVLPTPGSDGNRRTIVFSGDPSLGASAAVRFFTEPRYLRPLKQHFETLGYSQFPTAYQVLLRCKIDENLAESFTYQSSVVLRK